MLRSSRYNTAAYRPGRGRGASTRAAAGQRRPWRARLSRMLVSLFGLGLLLLAGHAVHEAYQEVHSRRIATVHIEGDLQYVSEAELEAAVGRFATTSLVAMELDLLKQELETLPWIHTVQVRREWPDRLVIRVEEEQPIARWGERELLNQEGQRFAPQDVRAQMQLPNLRGPRDSEQVVMRQYLQFNQLLYPLGVRIQDLALNERGAWSLVLTNGVEVRLGKEAVLPRLRRLVVFLESEFGQDIGDIAAIDLRYRNGIAVAGRSIDSDDTEIAAADAAGADVVSL